MLCVDVLFELFRYFYVDELFHSFDGSIDQFATLLRNGNVPLHVRRIDAHFRKRILPKIEPMNVISICIRNVYHMAPVKLAQFARLEFLILHNVSARNWPRDLPDRLKYLTVHVRSKDRNVVLKNALSLASIQRLELNSSFLHFADFNELLPEPSTVEHLVLRSRRSLIDYDFLVNNVPCLRSLRSSLTHYPHRISSTAGIFTCLHTLDLDCKCLDIDAMLSHLTNHCAYTLRRCRLINVRSSLSTDIALVLLS